MFGKSRDAVYAKLFGTREYQAFPDELGALPSVEVRRYTAKAVSSDPECDIWVTSGMGDQAMVAENGTPLRRELIFYAPIGGDYAAGIRAIGRFPFDEGSYLDHGHTVQIYGSFFMPGGAGLLAADDLGAIELPHVFLGTTLLNRHRRLEDELVIDGLATEFLWVVPISAAELALKKERGREGLVELFEDRQLPWLFDPSRQSYL